MYGNFLYWRFNETQLLRNCVSFKYQYKKLLDQFSHKNDN